jgi:hypothetical protein
MPEFCNKHLRRASHWFHWGKKPSHNLPFVQPAKRQTITCNDNGVTRRYNEGQLPRSIQR